MRTVHHYRFSLTARISGMHCWCSYRVGETVRTVSCVVYCMVHNTIRCMGVRCGWVGEREDGSRQSGDFFPTTFPSFLPFLFPLSSFFFLPVGDNGDCGTVGLWVGEGAQSQLRTNTVDYSKVHSLTRQRLPDCMELLIYI